MITIDDDDIALNETNTVVNDNASITIPIINLYSNFAIIVLIILQLYENFMNLIQIIGNKYWSLENRKF